MAHPGEAHGDIEVTRALDLRYAGQSYELTIPLEEGLSDALGRARVAFDAQHMGRFSHADRTAPVEVVNARVTARVRSASVEGARLASGSGATATSEARVWVEGGWRDVPVFARDALGAGDHVEGPAIVTQLDTTTFVAPGWHGAVDAWGNLVLEHSR